MFKAAAPVGVNDPVIENGPVRLSGASLPHSRRLRDRHFRNYRIRALLYAGKPNWGLLATVSRVARGNRTPRLSQNL